MPGTYRCFMHGGKSPAALFKAQEAAALLRFPAIEALSKILSDFLDTAACAHCGRTQADANEIKAVITAARTVLDRTGMGPSATLEVKQSDGAINLASFTLEERAELAALTAQFKALKERVKNRVAGALPGGTAIDV